MSDTISPLTLTRLAPEHLFRLGCSLGQHLPSQGRVVIAQDARLSSDLITASLRSGLLAAGQNVILLGVVPLPALRFVVSSFQADIGIMIGAPNTSLAITQLRLLDASGQTHSFPAEVPASSPLAEPLGKAVRLDDAVGRYVEHCKQQLGHSAHLSQLHIVVDGANGACAEAAPLLLEELAGRVTRLGCRPDGRNINDGVGLGHPERVQTTLQAKQADYGLVLDALGSASLLYHSQWGWLELNGAAEGDGLLTGVRGILAHLSQQRAHSRG
ncbi:phosphohexomutase domain-containing protein [Ferrimonas marina]|uniref:phosphomannomutase n=1 Tax=Ferrimonas marina TaxID=299255 RepID=A0A1M5VBD6_9GAMM|nr:hypothetical protein [Ferrimonas marina]SHH72468.1 Phosphoglucomutase/phosphomannomutase, alpha/beta/alpha domain II [Ferrimonas marina]